MDPDQVLTVIGIRIRDTVSFHYQPTGSGSNYFDKVSLPDEYDGYDQQYENQGQQDCQHCKQIRSLPKQNKIEVNNYLIYSMTK